MHWLNQVFFSLDHTTEVGLVLFLSFFSACSILSFLNARFSIKDNCK